MGDDACRPPTDKQTHIYTHKHTYRVKTEEIFFTAKFFYFLFFFLYLFESKKDGFQQAERRAAAETAEHLINSLYDQSRHHNFQIYINFQSKCLTSKSDKYNESWDTLLTASDDVINIEMERDI